MTIQELIEKLQELANQSPLGLNTPVIIAENWYSMNAVQQETRDVLDTDIRLGKVNEFPIMRNLSEHVEGLIIGHLNAVV